MDRPPFPSGVQNHFIWEYFTKLQFFSHVLKDFLCLSRTLGFEHVAI